jgi:nucleoside-diphosphate-sugar epimerase
MITLVTGGTGLLGRYLIPALQERGDTVRALALSSDEVSWLEQRGVAIYRGDVRQPDTLVEPLRGAQRVYHMAAMMGSWLPLQEYYAVNVAGTENVCQAALDADVERLIHVSSWTVYGMDLGKPAREEFPLTPFQEPYALSKTDGDRVVQRMILHRHLPAVIVRPGTFFGPGDRLHFGRMADRVRAGKGVVIGSGRNALPFVYVTDVVQGLLAADQDRAVGKAYNITNDQPLGQEEFLRAIAAELGVKSPRLHVPYRPLYLAAYLAEQVANRKGGQPFVTRLGVKLFGTDNRHSIDKARSELGYAPHVSIREGIRLSAVWYQREQTVRAAAVPAVAS